MNRTKKIILVLFALVVSLVLGGYLYLDNHLTSDTFYEGVRVDGIDLGNLTLQEGINVLQESKSEKFEKEIKLKVDDDSDYIHNITLRNLNIEYNFEEVAMAGFEVGRLGNVFSRFTEVRNIQENPVDFTLDVSYNLDNLETILGEIAAKVEKEAVNAQFDFNKGDIKVTKASEGIKLDKESFLTEVSNMGDKILQEELLVIPTVKVKPEIEDDYYQKVNGVIGEFYTSFNKNIIDRNHNIKLSAGAFKEMLVMPGQVVSYNKVTGPKQAKYGYREAPVIVNGDLVPGMGGGVCQTSTTLYNALLLADLTIVERRNHSIPPGYVRNGTDAAVSTGHIDLVFRNDFDYPIMIDTKVEVSRVYFTIYGDKENRDYSVRISTSNIATIPYKVHENLDETLLPGTRELVQKGRNGYKVKTFKSIIRRGEVISTEQISQDYYRERDYIYKIGPEEVIIPETPVEEVEILDIVEDSDNNQGEANLELDSEETNDVNPDESLIESELSE